MMQSNRITYHPVLGTLDRKNEIDFKFNDKKMVAIEGDTIASALLANGIRTLRFHEERGTPRGIYCNIGHCYECRVSVNGVSGVRACLTLVEQDMKVVGGTVLPTPLKDWGEKHE